MPVPTQCFLSAGRISELKRLQCPILQLNFNFGSKTELIFNRILIGCQSWSNYQAPNLPQQNEVTEMKKNLVLFTIIFLLAAGKLVAQEELAMTFPGDTKTTKSNMPALPVFEFRASSAEIDVSSVSKDLIGEHIFGQMVSGKLYLLESKYTYEVPIVPGNPQMRTMIRKPVVYDAVKKIERHLKKSVKKGEVSAEVASAEFNKVLDVAFNVLTAETGDFEKAITESKDVNSLTNLFTKRVNLVF